MGALKQEKGKAVKDRQKLLTQLISVGLHLPLCSF